MRRDYKNGKGEEEMKEMRDEMRRMYEKGEMCHYVDEEDYEKWIDMIDKMEEREEVLIRSFEKYPNSKILWLKYVENGRDVKEKGRRMKEALKKVSKMESWKLYEVYIDYLIEEKGISKEEVEVEFLNLLRCEMYYRNEIRMRYLRWKYEKEGMESVRTICFKIWKEDQLTIELLKMILDFELEEKEKDEDQIRRVFELIVRREYMNETYWIDYIKWELKRQDMMKVHLLIQRALGYLRSSTNLMETYREWMGQ
jgi:hypothetical protein